MQTASLPRITVNDTPAVLPSRLPSVFGTGDDRRRIYCVAEMPFNAFDGTGRERPPTVPLPWFSVQLVMGADTVTLRITRDGERFTMDGYTYPSLAAAERTLYRACVVGFLVYERDAAALGLPVGLQWSTHHTTAGNVCRWSCTAAPQWLAETTSVHTTEHLPITARDRMCPAECPGSTVEPVTLDPSAWARCERCHTVKDSYDIDEDTGLCGTCETYNSSRVAL